MLEKTLEAIHDVLEPNVQPHVLEKIVCDTLGMICFIVAFLSMSTKFSCWHDEYGKMVLVKIKL